MTSRRKFLKNAGALGLFSAAGMGSTLGNFSALAAQSSGYKALVCVFFQGGLDNHDTILPYDTSSYNRYTDLRAPLFEEYGGDSASNSRGRDNLLPLSPGNAAAFGSRQFALPQDMAPLRTLFQNGNAAIVGNVGPLQQPVTRTQYENNKNLLPSKLFSHNDQQSTWLSLKPEGARFGWGGVFADAHLANNANSNETFTAISLAGNSVFLSGEAARPYQINADGVSEIRVFDRNRLAPTVGLSNDALDIMRDHLMSAGTQSGNLFVNDMADIRGASLEANDLFNDAFSSAPGLTTTFPNTNLGKQLKSVAQTISISGSLGVRRQVFFVAMPGFDTHSSQSSKIPTMQRDIADAIAAFYDATEQLGQALNVTLFTASDFGRTLTVNGGGTDHGWGGHHFVVGGAVNGGDIYGDMPLYDIGHDQEVGRGRLIPSVSVEQYAATLGAWFGLSNSELRAALPNLPNFSTSNLGFV